MKTTAPTLTDLFATPEEYFAHQAARITDADVQAIIDQEALIWGKFEQSKELRTYLTAMKKAMSLLQQHIAGRGGLKAGTVSAITAAFLYILDPMDVIPDSIPDIGYLDDVLVVQKCLEIIKPDLPV